MESKYMDSLWFLDRFRPTLNPPDVVFLLMVKHTHTNRVVASWHTDLTGWFGTSYTRWEGWFGDGPDGPPGKYVTFNPHEGMLPHTLSPEEFTDLLMREHGSPAPRGPGSLYYIHYTKNFIPKEVLRDLHFTVHCFRRDTGRSIFWNLEHMDFPSITCGNIYFESNQRAPVQDTEPGRVACVLWRLRNYISMHINLRCQIDQLVLDNGDIGFCFKKIHLDLGVLNSNPQDFQRLGNIREILLSMEGMKWT